MTKGQVAEKLQDMGYDAYIEDFNLKIGVDHFLTSKEHRKIVNILKELDYKSSWGWVVKKG